jgi:hypothetical protein
MQLAEQLEIARRRQEIADLDAGDQRTAAEFAKRISLPPIDLSAGVRAALDPFNLWASKRHARRCPAKPTTVALFALEQADMGVAMDTILAQLSAIEAMHCKFSLANPVRTAAVRSAMETIVKADPPRSWPKKDKAAFAMLPSDIRLILSKRQEQMDTELRRLQSKVARELELRRMNGAEKPESIHIETEKVENHEVQR